MSFKIICSTDLVLLEYLVHKEFPDCAGPIPIDNPFEDRQKFIGQSFLDTALNNKRKCYLCKNLEIFISAEKYWDSLLSGKFCKTNNLILAVDKLDSRTKFTKLFKNVTINPDLSKIKITSVLPELRALNSSQCLELFENCGKSFTRLYNEFTKIDLYASARDLDISEAYTELCNASLLPQKADDNVFNLVEDIVNKNVKSILNKLYVLDKTDFDFGLLVNLYNTFRMLYIYEECVARNTLANSGLTPFNIKTVSKFHGRYSRAQLLGILRFLQKLDIEIKQGLISSEYALDYMIVGVLSS